MLVPWGWSFPTLKYKYSFQYKKYNTKFVKRRVAVASTKIYGSNFIEQHSETVTV